jgi:hypothetical protein
MVGSNFAKRSTETTSQSSGSCLLTDLVPQNTSRHLGIFSCRTIFRKTRAHQVRQSLGHALDFIPEFADSCIAIQTQKPSKISRFVVVVQMELGHATAALAR